MGKPRLFGGAVLVLVLLGAACGGGDDAATPTGPTGTAEPTNGGAGADVLVMQDFSFDPAAASFSQGASVTLDNQGAALHNLTVEGTDIDMDVSGGQTGEVTLDLEPGSYEMVCKYHVAQGMVGTLEITG